MAKPKVVVPLTPEEELDAQIDELLAAIGRGAQGGGQGLRVQQRQRLRLWRRAGVHQGGNAREEDLRRWSAKLDCDGHRRRCARRGKARCASRWTGSSGYCARW